MKHVAVDDADRQAARRALARNWPDLENSSPKFAAFVEALAEYHRRFGADSFNLRYNLRPPKDREEAWALQAMNGEISQAEYEKRLKADAERPIDLEMLTAFCNAFQGNLTHYSGVLQEAANASRQPALNSQASERSIDDHVNALNTKLPLWPGNLETVFEFLEEQRLSSGSGLIKLGDFEATSAHWMAQLMFTRMSEAWRACLDIARRSQLDPHFLYSANAVDLFSHHWASTFPAPQSIAERMREEFVLARLALKRAVGIASQSSVLPSGPPGDTSSDEQPIDDESRNLILIGETFRIVGLAGHIFRPTPNSDKGIDGEIEFNDNAQRASGQRLYVQLKSGDSHLTFRSTDGKEIFRVKKRRHLEYWTAQAYPVILIVRQSSGMIRWMNVTDYLKANGQDSQSIVFQGQEFTPAAVAKLAAMALQHKASAGAKP